MTSFIYNPNSQNSKTAFKIVFALDKISEYFKNSLREKGKKYKLSPIQIQILIFIENHSNKYQTVNYISDEFNVSKATISDSIKTLEKRGLVKKVKSTKDSRSSLIKLDTKGEKIVDILSEFPQSLTDLVENIKSNNQELLWQELYNILNSLQSAGEINIQRMCNTCVHFSSKNHQSYCNLLNKVLESSDLRLDCNEHKNQKNL